MADVITKIRTNYFSVTDPEKLRALIKTVKTDGKAVTLVEKNGEFMFYCPADIMGTLTDRAKRQLEYDPDWADDNPDEAYSMDAFLAALKDLIAPGDACIVKSVGYEAMRSLFADAYIVTDKRVGYVGLDDVLRQKTRSMLENPSWETIFEG